MKDVVNKPLYEITKTCRACLQKEEIMESVTIGQLKDLFTKFTNLEVSENDGLPSKLCVNCVERLNNCFSFLDLCIKSDIILKEQKAIKIENDNDDGDSADVSLNHFLEINYEENQKENQIDAIKIEGNDIKVEELPEVKSTSKSKKKSRSRSQKKGKPRICHICNEVFPKIALLKDHMKEHSVTDPVCLECDKKFTSVSSLRAHQVIHTQIKSFVCHICGKSFRWKSNLQEHISVKHSDDKPFPCSKCPRRFKVAYSLKLHLERHTGTKKHICITCGYGALTMGDLKKHMSSHSDEKPFACKSCPKRYKTAGNLADHNKVHTGERPFSCDICSMGFRTRRVMRHHRMIHTGEKPHSCNVCQKSFTQKIALVSHMKVHREKTIVGVSV